MLPPPPAAGPAAPPQAIGRATVPTDTATPPPTPPEVAAVAMGRATVLIPKITAMGRAPVAAAPRPPAQITHPPAVYHAAGQPPERTGTSASSAVEDSGSLTGHVLRRGRVDVPGHRSRVVVIVLIIAAVVAAFMLFGLVIAGATSDVVRTLFEGVTG
jgi:hypothetical protein